MGRTGTDLRPQTLEEQLVLRKAGATDYTRQEPPIFACGAVFCMYPVTTPPKVTQGIRGCVTRATDRRVSHSPTSRMRTVALRNSGAQTRAGSQASFCTVPDQGKHAGNHQVVTRFTLFNQIRLRSVCSAVAASSLGIVYIGIH